VDLITKFLLESLNSSGYLYHYSKEKQPILQTLNKQKELDKTSERMEERSGKTDPLGRGLDYSDQISFFFEPIPMDLIREKMPENIRYNPKVYEYKVKIQNLEENIVFQIVIAPFELIVIRTLGRIFSNEKLFKKFLKNYAKLSKVLYTKKGINDLLKIQKQYEGYTLEGFQDWLNSKNPRRIEYRKKNYQAGIIHVKLYPESGEIKIESRRKI